MDKEVEYVVEPARRKISYVLMESHHDKICELAKLMNYKKCEILDILISEGLQSERFNELVDLATKIRGRKLR